MPLHLKIVTRAVVKQSSGDRDEHKQHAKHARRIELFYAADDHAPQPSSTAEHLADDQSDQAAACKANREALTSLPFHALQV